ncbi:MAG: DNA polymerase III subunit alpha, partial [Gammaproteobacteria bacterium]|nr:DNA polymerase III subunit alpha [Gammaproteobacteria bacterium]
QRVIVAGLVVAVSKRQTQKGTMMANVLLDDRTGRIEVTLFSDAYEQFNELLVNDHVLVVEGDLSHDEYRGGLSLRVNHVMEIEQARELKATSITLKLNTQHLEDRNLPAQAAADYLKTILAPFQGGSCIIRVVLEIPTAKCLVVFGEKWSVYPRDELLKQLERFTGPGQVKTGYGYRKRDSQEQVKQA